MMIDRVVELGDAAKLPFYIKMFADEGFPLSPGQTSVPDSLIDSLVISGNEATISARFTELMVTPTPISDAGDEQTRLMRMIGQL